MLGPRPAVVVGLLSAPLVLETPYTHYYVKSRFNATREALSALGITHLLLMDSGDYTRSILKRHYGPELAELTPIEVYQVRGAKVSLFALLRPLD